MTSTTTTRLILRRSSPCCDAAPTLDQVANVAVFLASDWATTMTATEVNITAGAVVD
jgi:enoyl-[acyl-carrier-protein] reductase (NADH)